MEIDEALTRHYLRLLIKLSFVVTVLLLLLLWCFPPTMPAQLPPGADPNQYVGLCHVNHQLCHMFSATVTGLCSATDTVMAALCDWGDRAIGGVAGGSQGGHQQAMHPMDPQGNPTGDKGLTDSSRAFLALSCGWHRSVVATVCNASQSIITTSCQLNHHLTKDLCVITASLYRRVVSLEPSLQPLVPAQQPPYQRSSSPPSSPSSPSAASSSSSSSSPTTSTSGSTTASSSRMTHNLTNSAPTSILEVIVNSNGTTQPLR